MKGCRTMKKKTTSRPLKFVYLFMVAVILFSMATMATSALTDANVSDTRHTDSGYLTNGSKTSFRYKSDDTSCYVYNDSSSCAVSVYVYGNTQASWSGAVNKSYLPYAKSVPVGAQKSIMNWVFEDITSEHGQGYAALWVWTPDSSKYEYLDFLWSPDSTQDYG